MTAPDDDVLRTALASKLGYTLYKSDHFPLAAKAPEADQFQPKWDPLHDSKFMQELMVMERITIFYNQHNVSVKLKDGTYISESVLTQDADHAVRRIIARACISDGEHYKDWIQRKEKNMYSSRTQYQALRLLYKADILDENGQLNEIYRNSDEE
jgi:hypothetical protein